jgi:hypothetical protein
MKANASDSFCASEAATLKKQIEAMDSRFHRQVHAVNGFGLYIGVGLRTGTAEITLITFAVLSMLAGFNLTVGANHVVSLAFLSAMAHNQVAKADASNRVGLLKALLVPASRAFIFFVYQSANYNWYITIRDIVSQAKSYLTYINFSNILRVWLNQRHGIGGFINASGVSMSGSLVKRRNIRTFAPSAKALIGTSRAKLKKDQQTRPKVVYNIKAHGRRTTTHEFEVRPLGLAPYGGTSITITTSPILIVMIVLLLTRSYLMVTMTASFLR